MVTSVYVATRNRVEKLRVAVNSVLAQTNNNFELIIVDDASDDGTLEYLRSMANSDARIKILRNESRCGPQVARNRAIGLASGEFVTGLDDDDWFHPERLAVLTESWKMMSSFSSNIFGLYTQDAIVIDGSVHSYSQKRGSICFDDFKSANFIGNQVFVPKSYVEAVGLYDVAMPAWQDMELFMRLAKRFGEAKLVDLPLYFYDRSPQPSRISSNEGKIRAACDLVIKKHYNMDPRAQQLLWLQVFSSGYGFRPRADDFVSLLRKGFWPKGIKELSLSWLRN